MQMLLPHPGDFLMPLCPYMGKEPAVHSRKSKFPSPHPQAFPRVLEYYHHLLTHCLLPRLSSHAPLSKPVTLGASDSLKIVLTAVEGKTPKRPHQALLLVKDTETGLETSFPFTVKDTGKGKVDLVRDRLFLFLFVTNAISRLKRICRHSFSPPQSPFWPPSSWVRLGPRPHSATMSLTWI